MVTNPIHSTRIVEAQRLVRQFDAACRQAGREVRQAVSDDDIMADLIKAQKGHPISVEDLIARYVQAADKFPLTVTRLFGMAPVLQAELVLERGLQIDPAVKAWLDSIPVSSYDQERWFFDVTMVSLGSVIWFRFANGYCCDAVQRKFLQTFLAAARQRGYDDVRFETA